MIKKNIVLMLLLGFLQAMVFYAPIATLYRQAQGITLSQITIIESICLALCLLLELPWGCGGQNRLQAHHDLLQPALFCFQDHLLASAQL